MWYKLIIFQTNWQPVYKTFNKPIQDVHGSCPLEDPDPELGQS